MKKRTIAVTVALMACGEGPVDPPTPLPPPPPPFTITIDWAGPPAARRAPYDRIIVATEQAAAWWTQTLRETRWPPVHTEHVCGGVGFQGELEGLHVVVLLDGLWPAIGMAGRCSHRPDNQLPLTARVRFDSVFVREAPYEYLYGVARHEIGHALGFGHRTWTRMGLVAEPFTDRAHFTGEQAGGAWGKPPLVRGSHWRHIDDLMGDGGYRYASTVLLAAFADLGYTVDMSRADGVAYP